MREAYNLTSEPQGMDVGRRNGEKVDDLWTPKTTFKPLQPNPSLIYTDRHGNQLNRSIWLRSDGNSSNFTQETLVDGERVCVDSYDCHWDAGCREFSNDGSGLGWNMSFASLLALADAGSVKCSGAVARGSVGFSFESNPWINGNIIPGAQDINLKSSERVPDINLPTRRGTEVFSRNFVQFAPATPDKVTTPECNLVVELQFGKSGLQNKEQEKRIDAAEIQPNKELQNLPDDSVPATVEIGSSNREKGRRNADFLIKTPQQKPVRKKHRPKVITEGNPRTPRTATPKPGASRENATAKKKHAQTSVSNISPEISAELCIESSDPRTEPALHQEDDHNKRKYTHKQVQTEALVAHPAEPGGKSSDPGAYQEILTGKRKYISRLDEEMSLPPLPIGATEEVFTEMTKQRTKKSCRRALNFGTKEKPTEETSKRRWTSNLKTEAPNKDSRESFQSKSAVQLAHGVEVVVETIQSGLAYELTQSLKQMLRDYMSLFAKPGPTTPDPPKTRLPCEKQDIRGHCSEAIQMTTQSVVGKTEKMEQHNNKKRSINSTNGFNCITGPSLTGKDASASKRKHATPNEQLETGSKNTVGIQYNALDAYLAVFPSFHKKKRTEKGHYPTTSSTSSRMNGGKDTMIPETKHQNGDLVGHPSTSKTNFQILVPNCNGSALAYTSREAGCLLYNQHNFESILAETRSSTKRRSAGSTRVRSLSSLTAQASCIMQTTNYSRQAQVNNSTQQVGNLQRPYTCLEALAAEMRATLTRKKRTKKRLSLVSYNSSANNKQSLGKIILYNQNQFATKALGSSAEAIWKKKYSVDAISEQLKHLDINRESFQMACRKHGELVPYSGRHEFHNALVLYGRDGTIVPFDGPFQPVKRRPPRAKVDLDTETDRVWKLLLKDINSEGIDGTDEEKAKWWEEERNVFRGRADSFIARMHLVQGDRRFSPWKGSVVDSVVGVFLTQNVSDHLSSSAFMSLAAHFPLNSKDKHQDCSEEKTSSISEEPLACIPGPQDSIKWNEVSNQSIHYQISVTLHVSDPEEKEVVNSNASRSSIFTVTSHNGRQKCESIQKKSTIEAMETENDQMADKSLENNLHSSQKSKISSQSSVYSPTVPIDAGKATFSENYHESEDLTDRASKKSVSGHGTLMELLGKAGSSMQQEFCSQGKGNVLVENHSHDNYDKQQSVDEDLKKMDRFNSSKGPSEISVDSSSYSHTHLNLDPGDAQVQCLKVSTTEARHSDKYNNGKSKMDSLSARTADSASQMTIFKEASRSPDTDLSCSCEKEDRQSTVNSPNGLVYYPTIVRNSLDEAQKTEQRGNLSFPNYSGATLVLVESTSEVEKQEKDMQKELIERRKAKSRRVGDEIRDDVDWEALRKEVLAYGEKRERTQNTMDSVDWEAVRCADVEEVADTIRERGMNNVLAARIKDFLNRLVTEHGSIDLEWLRDVPPDKAKEYLLTIRGLGLKSVECVRLLTLHHLAFPVDTNVGRIAVRLGWVPLQPLPESLQLHLLELYPVLESIQKYLWPRLCKLDQRTLYELHYQLITFGKVFCTKSKPNCNACPMRGECRHFASAFASARLALPGMEEKRIMSVTEDRTNGQVPSEDRFNLALLKAAEELPENQQLVVKRQPESTSVARTNDQIPSEDRFNLALLEAAEESPANQQLVVKRQSESTSGIKNCEPIIEEPSSPEPAYNVPVNDIEDALPVDPDEIPTIKLNMEAFTQNIQNYMQQNMELQGGDMSKALVTLTAEAASIPMPKLKNMSRLRTEHRVYELPDSHPLVEGLDIRELDDPSPYLLAIWTPGETADSVQPPESRCSAEEYGKLCDEETCFSCNSTREANSQTVRGTLLIPCRTAMRGSFPLNGTYFQVNEVFADHDSSLNPIDVPRSWIWNLPRRTVYFGTSVPNIFKGLTTEEIQHCFWRGFVCVRGFDQQTRAPRPLMARLHFPASKLKANGNAGDDK